MLVRPEGVTVERVAGEARLDARDHGRQRELPRRARPRHRAHRAADELVTVQVSNTAVTDYRPGDAVRLSPRGDAALAVAAS